MEHAENMIASVHHSGDGRAQGGVQIRGQIQTDGGVGALVGLGNQGHVSDRR